MKKATKTIQRVGVIANLSKPSSRELLQQAASLITKAGRETLADEATAKLASLSVNTVPHLRTLAQKADLLLVFGGDGTMLRVAREMHGSTIPLLGVKVGGLGFLTDVPSTELAPALGLVWEGRFEVQPRAMIQAEARCHDRTVQAFALNDFVISRGIVSRLIELEVLVDGEILTRYRCDGLIVSTPTGSTAYSLAAGGAVVFPTAEVLIITPVCPHTLSNRSVIISLDSTVDVTVISERPETILSADGQSEIQMSAGDLVTIRRSPHDINIVHLEGTSFFETLRRKLQWSGSNVISR